MPVSLPERDWKYLTSVKEQLVAELCRKINEGAAQILAAGKLGEHEKYQKLFRYMESSDRKVANCFDDWRRSTLLMRVVSLRKHGLLSDEHVQNLSPELQDRLALLYPSR